MNRPQQKLHNYEMHPAKLLPLSKAAIFLALILLAVSLACGSSADTADQTTPKDDLALVWEAWSTIKESYVNTDKLDSAAVVGSTIEHLLDLANAPPYPFLTEVGRLRGQPPADVPRELGDVWRALVLHQQKWPELQRSVVAQAAIVGMVDGLGDPSAGFITAENVSEAQETLAGSYQGIGASVMLDQNRILLFPREGTPAERAGIRARDVLVAVEGQPVAGRSVSEITNQVKGPAGTKVRLTVERAGEPAPLEFEVLRGNVDIPSIEFQLVPGGIGYIAINEFKENTGDKFVEAMERFKQVDMLALILDLRANRAETSRRPSRWRASFCPQEGCLCMRLTEWGNGRIGPSWKGAWQPKSCL